MRVPSCLLIRTSSRSLPLPPLVLSPLRYPRLLSLPLDGACDRSTLPARGVASLTSTTGIAPASAPGIRLRLTLAARGVSWSDWGSRLGMLTPSALCCAAAVDLRGVVGAGSPAAVSPADARVDGATVDCVRRCDLVGVGGGPIAPGAIAVGSKLRRTLADLGVCGSGSPLPCSGLLGLSLNRVGARRGEGTGSSENAGCSFLLARLASSIRSTSFVRSSSARRDAASTLPPRLWFGAAMDSNTSRRRATSPLVGVAPSNERGRRFGVERVRGASSVAREVGAAVVEETMTSVCGAVGACVRVGRRGVSGTKPCVAVSRTGRDGGVRGRGTSCSCGPVLRDEVSESEGEG